jgi:hypothetical protein
MEFNAALKTLQDAAACSTDPRLAAMVIALQDKRVRELFQSRFKRGHVFSGIDSLGGTAIPEQSRLVFLFDPPPGELCFVRPLFLVVVNIVEKLVIQIVDPHIPGPFAGSGTRASGMPFTLCIPSAAPRVVVKDEQLAPFRAREANFLGTSPGALSSNTHSPNGTTLGSPYQTADSTSSNTSTMCPQQDDSTTDYHGDYHSDWEADHYVDQETDD